VKAKSHKRVRAREVRQTRRGQVRIEQLGFMLPPQLLDFFSCCELDTNDALGPLELILLSRALTLLRARDPKCCYLPNNSWRKPAFQGLRNTQKALRQ
jgi:hypothetical protein